MASNPDTNISNNRYVMMPYSGEQTAGAVHRNTTFTSTPIEQGIGAPYPYSQQVVTTSYVTVPDNRCLAWFACICCFLPLGLVAVLRANKSRDAMARGDIEGAKLHAADARLFSVASIFFGLIIILTMLKMFADLTNGRREVHCDCGRV